MNAKVAGRPRMSSEERKACIVDAACRLFSEKGFRGVTTRELAAAVGVTEPVLYEHFRTKSELYRAIIEEKASEGIEILNRLAEQVGDADERIFFGALAKAILNWYTEDPAVVRLLLYSSLEGHDLKDLFHQRSRQCFDVVNDYIARRIAQCRMRAVDPAVAARAFFGMIAHYAQSAVIFNVAPIPKNPHDVIGEMVDLYLSGLCTEQNS